MRNRGLLPKRTSIRQCSGLLLAAACVLAVAAGSQAGADRLAAGDLEAHHIRIYNQTNTSVVGISCKVRRPNIVYYGTGVLVSRDGFILTATTVIPSDAVDIDVIFRGGDIFKARVMKDFKYPEPLYVLPGEVVEG